MTVTKKDLNQVKYIFKKDLNQVKTELKTDIQKTKSQLETKIKEAESRLEGKIKDTESRLEGKMKETESKLEGKIKTTKDELLDVMRKNNIWIEHRFDKVDENIFKMGVVLEAMRSDFRAAFEGHQIHEEKLNNHELRISKLEKSRHL